MKAMNLIMSVWTSGLVAFFIFGVAYAIYQIASGNFPPIYI